MIFWEKVSRYLNTYLLLIIIILFPSAVWYSHFHLRHLNTLNYQHRYRTCLSDNNYLWEQKRANACRGSLIVSTTMTQFLIFARHPLSQSINKLIATETLIKTRVNYETSLPFHTGCPKQ